MSSESNHITVFEHETIRIDRGHRRITEEQLKAFQLHYGEGVPYFELTHNGIRFNEYVGVVQIGKTIIEVLPKADKKTVSSNEESKWRHVLISMLNAVGSLDIKSTSESDLKIKPNSVLDLYFMMFVREVEYLLHNGLVKKYRSEEGNVFALKGNLHFGRHIQHNITHQERFYVRHTIYDLEHKLHQILFKAIRLLSHINTNSGLQGRIGRLLLNFPEMPEIKVTEETFDRIVLTKKTRLYKKAIEISKLILLKYHPNVIKGKHNVLALMFDMNKLWEEFILLSLRKHKEHGTIITAQTSKFFWKPNDGYRSKIKPDIVVTKANGECIVLDTKWKNLNGYNPSPEDLRQMYVYHEYYGAKKVALVYPAQDYAQSEGTYLHPTTSAETGKICSIISLSVESNIKLWQENINKVVINWTNQ